MMKKIKGLITTTRGKETSLPKPHTKQMENILKRQAIKRRGELKSGLVNTHDLGYVGKHLVFPYHNLKVFVIPTVLGADAPARTILKVKFRLSQKIKFYVFYKKIMHHINLWIINPRKILIGNPNFDYKFQIGSNDKNFAENVLKTDIQNRLLEMGKNGFRPAIRISKNHFTFTCLSWLSEKDYDDLIDVSLLIIDKIRWLGYIELYSPKDGC